MLYLCQYRRTIYYLPEVDWASMALPFLSLYFRQPFSTFFESRSQTGTLFSFLCFYIFLMPYICLCCQDFSTLCTH